MANANTEYTPEQQKDILERTKKACAVLKDLQLTPACVLTFVNTGNDTFSVKPLPYLQDFKYTPTPSPLQKEDIQPPKA